MIKGNVTDKFMSCSHNFIKIDYAYLRFKWKYGGTIKFHLFNRLFSYTMNYNRVIIGRITSHQVHG